MTMATTTVHAMRAALKRRCMPQLFIASWREYTNLILDKTKYVGNGCNGTNRAHIRREMVGRTDEGGFMESGWLMRRNNHYGMPSPLDCVCVCVGG